MCNSDRHECSNECITITSELSEHAAPSTSSAPSPLIKTLSRTVSKMHPCFQDAPICSHSDACSTVWHAKSLSKVGTIVPTEHGTSVQTECMYSAAAMASIPSRFLSQEACPVSPQVSENLALFCQRYGMHAMASTGWAMMSLQPKACAILSIASLSSCTILSFIIYFVGLLHSSWQPYLAIVAAVSIASMCVVVVMFYMYGPLFTRSKCFAFAAAVWSLPMLFLSVLGIVGGQNVVPFQNRVVFACLLCLNLLLSNIAGVLGISPDDQPLCPHSSLCPPLISASGRTLVSVDALTNMSLVRLILLQVLCQPCLGL
jgi:hypothetical protein